MTAYQVLCYDKSINGWKEIGNPVEASSPEGAIRELLGDSDSPAELWRAIPTRSWKPDPIKAEVWTEKKVVLR